MVPVCGIRHALSDDTVLTEEPTTSASHRSATNMTTVHTRAKRIFNFNDDTEPHTGCQRHTRKTKNTMPFPVWEAVAVPDADFDLHAPRTVRHFAR